jgi:hypothetical protein
MKSRWFWFCVAILAGIGLGLVYGWVLNPVKYVDTTPDSLSHDYKTDYILMVAEAYRADGNLDQVSRRLAFLGDDPPLKLVQDAILYAGEAKYSAADVELMVRLSQALQTWKPSVQNNPGGS